MIAEAVLCLALNVYHEARSEPWEGRMAVALVTRNRARRHHTGICWETFRDRQFSWTLDRTLRQRLPTGAAWQDAQWIARTALNTSTDFTGGATHFHHVSISYPWNDRLKFVGRWGDALFYKENE